MIEPTICYPVLNDGLLRGNEMATAILMMAMVAVAPEVLSKVGSVTLRASLRCVI